MDVAERRKRTLTHPQNERGSTLAEESRFEGFTRKTILGALAFELGRLQELFGKSDNVDESMRIGTTHAYLRELHDFLSPSDTLEIAPSCPVVPLITSAQIEVIEIIPLREFLLCACAMIGPQADKQT